MNHILFTGGGSAGHVIPNLALIKKCQQANWRISYLGSHQGIEQQLLSPTNIPFYGIATGKLRRYFSWQNFIDPFKILYGILQACYLCRKLKPQVVFSKGGFVAVPVVIAAWLNRIPIVIHEADASMGLANKICSPLATHICLTFPFPCNKALVTGIPIRDLKGDVTQGLRLCNWSASTKPTILVFGGSLGSDAINTTIRQILPELTKNYRIIHICGVKKIQPELNSTNYHQFEFLQEEFPHILAAADLVIARAGANTLYELITLRKPNILIPLTTNASRGEQLQNAKFAAQHHLSTVIYNHELTPTKLITTIQHMLQTLPAITKKMQDFPILDSTQIIYDLLLDVVKKTRV